MGKMTVLALRVVIAMVLAGSLFVQVRMVPLLSADLQEAGAPNGARLGFLVDRGAGHCLRRRSPPCVSGGC